jgi:hypothetical protein
LDRDSTEVPIYGQQENSAHNGHLESTGHHPPLLFNREGDCLAAKLRPGNVHSAEGWKELLLPKIERQQKQGKQVVFRADAAFPKPEIYEALEERDVKYAIRIPSNDSLQRDIAELLTRAGPGGAPRPSHKPVVRYKSFLDQSRELEQGPAGGGQGGVPRRRAVSAGRIHRDQPGGRVPGRRCDSTTGAARLSSGSRKASRR